MTIKELRDKTNMTRQEFGDYLGIPRNTIRNWEQGVRNPVPYVISLIERVLCLEGKINDSKENKEEQ